MKNKFHIRIELELHSITCPGVWLCTNGSIELTIKSLGYYFKTGPMEPKFPVLCHEQFIMEGFFKSVRCLSELNRILGAENIQICLWQSGRRLSYFNGKLAEIIRTSFPYTTCFHNINVQILMSPSHCFPGIIAPKLEISSRAVILNHDSRQQETSICNLHSIPISPQFSLRDYHLTSHMRFENLSGSNQIRRQKPVCHLRKDTSDFARWNLNKSVSPMVGGRRESSSWCPSVTDFERGSFNDSRSPTCSSTSSGDIFPGLNNFCDCQGSGHGKNCQICDSYKKTFFSTN